MKALLLLTSSLALLLMAGCAPTNRTSTMQAGSGGCFYASEISNFKLVDRNTVNFRVGVSDIYEAHLLGSCGDIAWTDAIGVDAGPNSLVCDGLGTTLIVPTTTTPRRCPIDSIRKLSRAEASTLPYGTKP